MVLWFCKKNRDVYWRIQGKCLNVYNFLLNKKIIILKILYQKQDNETNMTKCYQLPHLGNEYTEIHQSFYFSMYEILIIEKKSLFKKEGKKG